MANDFKQPAEPDPAGGCLNFLPIVMLVLGFTMLGIHFL